MVVADDDAIDLDAPLHRAGRAPFELRFVEIDELLTRGGHLPVRCGLEFADGTPAGSWVVKPPCSLGDGEAREELSVLAELAGAEVAAWLSIPTPALGVMRVAEGLSDRHFAAQGADAPVLREIFRVNAGRLAFCSRFLEGASEYLTDRYREGGLHGPELLHQFGPVLMFLDAYVLHDDRTERKPNVLEHQYRMVPIDHGSAFVGIDRGGRGCADVVAATRLHTIWRNHVFAEPLRRARSSLKETVMGAVRAVEGVADDAILRLAETWPRELRRATGRDGSDPVDETVHMLLRRRAHAAEIGEQLISFLEPTNG